MTSFHAKRILAPSAVSPTEIFALLWLPRVAGYLWIFATWGGVFEQLSLVAAVVLVYASVNNIDPAVKSRIEQIGRLLYGICVLSFALNHFFAIPETAKMVPKWIPPAQDFWAVATGVAHMLAAIEILSGVLVALASRLLTLMLILFGALVWVPALVGNPGQRIVWAGNAIHLARTGGVWVIADWFANRELEIAGEHIPTLSPRESLRCSHIS